MSAKEKLKQYIDKRNLNRSGEPSDSDGAGNGGNRFVIQKHDASNLHYDLRLEVDGVLKSWAVPKGPSTDPSERRLAIRTEDHPTEYANFEGVIPEDEYGGGTLLVWDTGEFKNLRAEKDEPLTMEESLDDGLLEVWLEGEKLQGGYAMKRTRKSQWLLIKMKDDAADARRNPVSTEPDSVLSGRSLADIMQEADKE
ncbi:MAG: DNA ligase [Ectothiorhodospiraceae bacterium]|nr:DNA ligase [Ectothiorhodospiraceae bacterium]